MARVTNAERRLIDYLERTMRGNPMAEHLEAGPALSADERMRAALMAILNRVESAEDLTYGKLPGYAYAIALEATEALSEAYPDDPLYQRLRVEWEARAEAPYFIHRRREQP